MSLKASRKTTRSRFSHSDRGDRGPINPYVAGGAAVLSSACSPPPPDLEDLGLLPLRRRDQFEPPVRDGFRDGRPTGMGRGNWRKFLK